VDTLSRPRLHDHIERRLGSATHAREAALENDLAQSGLAGLRAERGAASCDSDVGAIMVDAA
jgi:hypothetical protein